MICELCRLLYRIQWANTYSTKARNESPNTTPTNTIAMLLRVDVDVSRVSGTSLADAFFPSSDTGVTGAGLVLATIGKRIAIEGHCDVSSPSPR